MKVYYEVRQYKTYDGSDCNIPLYFKRSLNDAFKYLQDLETYWNRDKNSKYAFEVVEEQT